jgi:hypothetical protein
MDALIIGVDCATVDEKIGLAFADYHRARVSIRDATLCTREGSAVATVAGWLKCCGGRVLLTMDAPLGWPEPLARTLAVHRAGERLGAPPNEMFRRETDRFIQKELSKTPLDVGADRIARTAHAALQLLDDVRRQTGFAIPLAWNPEFPGVSAIEVYPAATLVAHGCRSTGYKRPEHVEERRQIIASIASALDINKYCALFERSADALDAAVCVLSGKDFLESRAMSPRDHALAEREGWIWAAPRQKGGQA